jgi:hypothetical protein
VWGKLIINAYIHKTYIHKYINLSFQVGISTRKENKAK